MLIVAALVVGLSRSLAVFLFIDTDEEVYSLVPLWGFGLVLLSMYWPFARVTIQEALGWSYDSLNGALFFHWFSGSLIMSVVVALQARDVNRT